jgi:hypothetical protein
MCAFYLTTQSLVLISLKYAVMTGETFEFSVLFKNKLLFYNYFYKGVSYMPKYVIERDIPDAGNLSAQELQAISQKSCGVLRGMGPQIQWLQSYVTGDKIYCVYIAANEEMVREHASQGDFPANRVSEVKNIIDPTTAEA